MKPQEILGTRASTVRPPNQQPHLSSSGETWIPTQVSPTSKPAHEETNRNHSKKHRPGRRSSLGRPEFIAIRSEELVADVEEQNFAR